MYATQENLRPEKPRTFENSVCGKYLFFPDETGRRKAQGGLRTKGQYKRSLEGKPLISIITVVFNGGKTLERCILSVLEQDYDNIEYIVIDGGSNDKTIDVICKYESAIDYYISEPDQGIYNAMNKGISLSTGQYLCLVNSDDYIDKLFVKKMLCEILKRDTCIVYSDFLINGKSNNVSPQIDDGILVNTKGICHLAMLVSKDVYNTVGYYYEKYKIVSDIRWIRDAYKDKIPFYCIKESLYYFSLNGMSDGASELTRKKIIDENSLEIMRSFPKINYHESQSLYLFKFDPFYSRSIIKIINKYKEEEELIRAIKCYFEYCLIHLEVFYSSKKSNREKIQNIIELSLLLDINLGLIKFEDIFLRDKILHINQLSQKLDNKRKTILHFSRVFSAPTETFIYDILTSLEQAGDWQGVYLCNDRMLEKERIFDKVIHIPYDLFCKYYYIFCKIILNLLKPDVVIMHFMLNSFHFFQSIKFEHFNVPMVHMTHGIDIFSINVKKDYRDFVLNFVNIHPNHTITTVSKYLKDALIERGVRKDKISIVHNCSNEIFYRNRKTSFFKQAAGKKLRIINVARFIELKGHRFLFEGLRYFIDNCSENVELTLVHGRSPEREVERIQRLINELNLTKKVILIDFIDFGLNPDFYTQFDIAVTASTYCNNLYRSEGLPVSTLEAIMAGLPIVGTDAGGTPEVIGYQTEHSQIIPHGDGLAIGKALEQMFVRGKCFSDNGKYATERFQHFSRKEQIKLLEAAISKAMKPPIKVAMFCTTDKGGAGNATCRLNQSLLNNNVMSTLYLIHKVKKENYFFIQLATGFSSTQKTITEVFRRNIFSGNTIFSPTMPNTLNDIFQNMSSQVDIFNIGWVAGFLSVENIAYLSQLRVPLVMTIRDMHLLTGGCHYFHGCDKWKTDCINCPQLKNNYDNFPAKVLATKKKYWNFSNITVVCLSKHSKEIVKDSIFRNCRIEIIPNSIQTDIFCPKDKLSSRKKFNIDLNAKVVFVLPSATSSVKGFNEFSKTLEYLAKDHNDYLILLAGHGTNNFSVKDFAVKNLGYIDDKEKLAMAYSLADVTAVPSLEETFSNTTAESLSCGTPVVGFKVGGLPDMIQDGVNGYTVALGDCEALAEAIVRVLDGPDLSVNCRRYAEENLTLELQGQRYKVLYEDLLSNRPPKVESPNPIPEVFPELASSQVQILTDVLSQVKPLSPNDPLMLLNTLPTYRLAWTMGIRLTKKLRIYRALCPLARLVKSFMKKVSLESDKRFSELSNKRKLWLIAKVLSKKLHIYRLIRPLANQIEKQLRRRKIKSR